MKERPDLAVFIARVAVGWSRVEERLGYIIVQLLRAEAHTGMKMYQALTSSAAQFGVLRAVARDRLDKDMQDKLEELLADYKKVAKQRNKIVHGHWDTSEQHPAISFGLTRRTTPLATVRFGRDTMQQTHSKGRWNLLAASKGQCRRSCYIISRTFRTCLMQCYGLPAVSRLST